MDFKSKWFRYGPFALVFLFAIPTLLTASSQLETYFFPVVKDIQIEKLELNTYGNPVISGTIIRFRGGCIFRNMIFFTKTAEFETPIGIQTPGRVIGRDRAAGEYKFGPWTLFTTMKVLENQSYARLIHSCHPFYDTVTYLDMKDFLNGKE